jgi:hypothetical protein
MKRFPNGMGFRWPALPAIPTALGYKMGVSVNGGTLIAGWFIWKNEKNG